MSKLISKRVFAVLLALLASGAASADSPAVPAPEDVVEQLGLQPGEAPASSLEGWQRPQRIVIRVDSADRLAWMQEVAPGVELIGLTDISESGDRVEGAQAVIGICEPGYLDDGAGLVWIQIFSAGAENCVARLKANGRNILLTNMQRVSSPEIAEHVIAMLLSFTRGLNQFIRVQPQGRWLPALVPMEQRWELGGRTMLVVGLGGIGTQVARRASALGMKVMAIRNSSRSGPDYVDYVGLPDELHALASEADAVVNTTPLTASTSGLFDARFFEQVKPTAYFINVGRGKSVDTDALTKALREGRLAGAGLDVTDPEPLPPDHPLWQFENVIITPHVSAGSDRIRERLFTVVRENLRRYVAGEAMLSVVDIERGY